MVLRPYARLLSFIARTKSTQLVSDLGDRFEVLVVDRALELLQRHVERGEHLPIDLAHHPLPRVGEGEGIRVDCVDVLGAGVDDQLRSPYADAAEVDLRDRQVPQSEVAHQARDLDRRGGRSGGIAFGSGPGKGRHGVVQQRAKQGRISDSARSETADSSSPARRSTSDRSSSSDAWTADALSVIAFDRASGISPAAASVGTAIASASTSASAAV